MQIGIKREDLLSPLGVVAGVVERRQTLPILSYALLKRDGDNLTLTGTDLEIEVTTKINAQISNDEAITIPARKLLDICRALPANTEIKINHAANKATLTAGRSRFTLVTLPAVDFPSIEAVQWDLDISVTQNEFRKLLENTQFCMAQQDVRYYLNGLLLEFRQGALRAVATDGHRMAISEMPLKNVDVSDRQAIVPRKGVQEMIRLLSEAEDAAEAQIGTNHIRIKTPETTFTSKLVDGRFPDYEKVIPVNQSKEIKLERTAFREALSRVAILSNEKYRGVRIGLHKGTMTITAHNPEQEEAEEELGIPYEGEDMEIGFNVNYLIDATGALGTEEITLMLNDPDSSCTVFSPGDTKTQYVIMPMRL